MVKRKIIISKSDIFSEKKYNFFKYLITNSNFMSVNNYNDYIEKNFFNYFTCTHTFNGKKLCNKININIFFEKFYNNSFLCIEQKHNLLLLFCKMNKIYNSFCKLMTFVKRHKSIDYVFSKTLDYSDLNEIPDKNKIKIFQENVMYEFSLQDLSKIINRCLYNMTFNFPAVITIKNPWTNIKFSTCDIYNIYFKMTQSNINVPILFHLYYKELFNNHTFEMKYDAFIREQYVNNKYNDMTFNEKVKKIKKLCNIFGFFNFELDSKYPINIFVKALSPILKLGYQLYSGVSPQYHFFLKIKMYLLFDYFKKKNPNFGRTILKVHHNDFTQKTSKKRKRWVEHVHQVNYIPLNNDIQHSIEDMITNNKYRRATVTNIIDNIDIYQLGNNNDSDDDNDSDNESIDTSELFDDDISVS